MALKFIDKLKNIDLSKASDAVSGAKVSLSNMFDKNSAPEQEEALADKQFATLSDENLDPEKIAKAEGRAQELAEKTNELQERVLQYLVDNGEKLKSWYSDNQINEKITKVAKKAGSIIIYPVLLLVNLLKSPQTAVKDKMFIIAPLAYFILPTDLIPDFIMGAGYVDDGFAITTSLKSLSSSITPEIQEQTKSQCKELLGEVDEKVLTQITDVISENQDKIAHH